MKIITGIAYGIVSLLLLNFMILAAAITQILIEGRTGHWNEWFLWQARVLIGLLN